MRNNTSTARAPNKRTFVKLGAVVVTAMLGVGAFSLVDTASAYDPYETYTGQDGNPVTLTTVTDSEDPGAKPPLPEGYEHPEFKWYNTDSAEGTRTERETSARLHEAPSDERPDGATEATKWRPGDPVHYGRVGGEWVRLREHTLTGNWTQPEAPNRELTSAGQGQANNVRWNETGGLADHALEAARASLVGQEYVIYNTSPDTGQGSWFMVDAGGGLVTELGTSYIWTRDVTYPEWTHTWTLKQNVEQTVVEDYCDDCEDLLLHCDRCDVCDEDSEGPGIGHGSGIWVQQEWTGGPSVEMPAFDSGGWHTPPGQVDRVPNLPEGREEGVPFHGQGRGSWKRWVRIDADAWNQHPQVREVVVLTQNPGY